MSHALLVISILLLIHASLNGSASPQDKCFFDAIYNFGNSLSDTGNLLREGPTGALSTIVNLPFGMTFPGKPTGRCSDGRLIIDYIAMGLNLPLLPPYLDKEANFKYGANFAVAGATALDKSLLLEKGINTSFTNSSLSVQLNWFNHVINSKFSKQSECANKLKKSLFFVGEIGGNDYNYALLGGKPIEEVITYVPLVVDQIVRAAKKLMNVGARYLIVPGILPNGCFPIYLETAGTSDASAYDENNCLRGINTFAKYHNDYLQGELKKLRRDYPKATIVYADYYNAFLSLVLNPDLFGFDPNTTTKACCGAGGKYNFNIRQFCGSPGTTVCHVPSKYLTWDGIHPTQEAYKMMTTKLISHGVGFFNPNTNK